ncbi:nucleotidyltransferase family protein [Rufibacter immobilis]|uniref:nucleotidyltransferase family protein n=1 Tax=Rufibacter immobilis TaxID=1348778 RepID=UPI0035E72894
MSTKPTLLILAAGLATRYGSLKQLDSFGPNGETIIDYSVYDAVKAGFGKIIFVIRTSLQAEFETTLRSRFPSQIEISYIPQELNMLPFPFQVPKDRVKPWGTGHAVWAARTVIHEPFAVINGDDFYGFNSLRLAANFLNGSPEEGEHALIAFKLWNTLSPNGGVSRGVCEKDPNGYLKSVTEQTHLLQTEDGVSSLNQAMGTSLLTGQELVSMNLMAFKPSVFPSFEQELIAFLSKSLASPTAEFYLPAVVDNIVKNGQARVRVLETPDNWFGVTYPEDKPAVVQRLQQLIREGIYPNNLWHNFPPAR